MQKENKEKQENTAEALRCCRRLTFEKKYIYNIWEVSSACLPASFPLCWFLRGTDFHLKDKSNRGTGNAIGERQHVNDDDASVVLYLRECLSFPLWGKWAGGKCTSCHTSTWWGEIFFSSFWVKESRNNRPTLWLFGRCFRFSCWKKKKKVQVFQFIINWSLCSAALVSLLTQRSSQRFLPTFAQCKVPGNKFYCK